MVTYTPIMPPLSPPLLTIRCVTINYLSPKVKASLDRLIFCFEGIRTRKCHILYFWIALRQNVNNCVPSSRLWQKNRTSGYLISLVGNSVHVRIFLCQEVQNIIADQLYTSQLKRSQKFSSFFSPSIPCGYRVFQDVWGGQAPQRYVRLQPTVAAVAAQPVRCAGCPWPPEGHECTHRLREAEAEEVQQLVVVQFGDPPFTARGYHFLRHAGFFFQHDIDFFFDSALRDEFVDHDIFLLTNAEGSIGCLVFHRRIPPAIKVDDVIRFGQV